MFDSIIVLGATATGKTGLSIKLAKKLNAEIINADSMYVYKYFDIGTAKPTLEEMDGVKHHLIGYIDPNEDCSVASFREDAKNAITKFKEQNILPIIVGGTGFYIDSLIKPYTYGNVCRDDNLRQKLERELDEFGSDYLYNKLKNIDAIAANKLHPNDTKRVIRALEIAMLSNTKKSNINNNSDVILKCPLIIGLNIDRDILYNKINNRVDIMIENGLIEEVKSLYNQGYNVNNCNAMKGIGYKEILEYLDNKCTLDYAIDKIKQHTRNYAKRQLTWFRRNDKIIWMNPANKDIVDNILKIYYGN